MITSRRGLLLGFGSVLAAPAIVRASSLMPVKVWRETPVLGPDITATEVMRYVHPQFSNKLLEEFVDLYYEKISIILNENRLWVASQRC